MMYLAQPYSHSDPKIRERRFKLAEILVATLVANELPKIKYIYSPIVHWHQIATEFDLPVTFDFWWELNFDMIKKAQALLIFRLREWEKSLGLYSEIVYAIEQAPPMEKYIIDMGVEGDGDLAFTISSPVSDDHLIKEILPQFDHHKDPHQHGKNN